MSKQSIIKKPFVKICGQTHQSATDNASSCGASYLGFIFHPRSPRSISPSHAAEIRTVGVNRVGVFVKQKAEAICDIMQQARLNYAQLHGAQNMADADKIGTERVIRVIWPERHETVASLQAEINQWAPHCAFFLLDAGKQGGGHGKRIALENIKGIHFPKPWILAGGLDAENVKELIQVCQPDGLDLNSGLEFSPGFKHTRHLLDAFKSI